MAFMACKGFSVRKSESVEFSFISMECIKNVVVRSKNWTVCLVTICCPRNLRKTNLKRQHFLKNSLS